MQHTVRRRVARARGRTPLVVRPIAPSDKTALAAFFAALSPESRKRRFFTSKAALSARELAYFTEIDHRSHVGLVAEDAAGRFVGLGQYAGWAGDARTADVAVAVADDHQRRGLGTKLVRDLVERARVNGLDRLTASTQPWNVASLRLLRRAGFRVAGSGGGVIEFELDL
jgi:ribosomal protein S18 acetylase RimI-like enzyme